MILPDVVALEQAVRVLELVRLLALDGPEPPGVVDHRPEPVACAEINHTQLLKSGRNHSSFYQLLTESKYPTCISHEDKNQLTYTPLPLSSVVELLPQHQEVDDIGHVVVPATSRGGHDVILSFQEVAAAFIVCFLQPDRHYWPI